MDDTDGKRHDVALFRYALVREASDDALTPRQRGELVRDLASREHMHPSGRRVRVSRPTLDRWIRAFRQGGFQALISPERKAQPRTPAELLELAEALKREAPRRTAAQVVQVMVAAHGAAPSERTLQRHFARTGLNRLAGAQAPRAYGRFEAERPNDLWTGDALHGPRVNTRPTCLFAFIDDHSRLLTGYRWCHAEDTLRLESALRAGLESRGVPRSTYVDNGSPFISKQLLRACATLRIRLIHSRPGQPAGRGKIERVFRTVRDQFLVELHVRGASGLPELNELFQAWVEGVYHRRVHTETGQAPIERFLHHGAPALPEPAQLREAFLWAERRTVTKTATLSMHGNVYEVDQALVGQRVELVYDPFDLQRIEVRFNGRPMGQAVAHRVSRRVHPQARSDEPAPPPPRTGIDYLGMIRAHHLEAQRRRINYSGIEQIPTDQTDERTEENPS